VILLFGGIYHLHPAPGKWWLVGAAWVGNQATNPNPQVKNIVDDADAKNNALLQLAKAQRMNTDIRKSIFVILMSSEVHISSPPTTI
jgi:nucleolar MIF4G domain-containing protein 1